MAGNGENGAVSITGTVERITYKNKLNHYTVASVTTDSESLTVVGQFPDLNEGETAEFHGNYTVHPTYGRQFKAETCVKKAPQSAAGILKFLSSGAVKGIGPSTARKIVEKFGEESLDVIKNRPELLVSIRGISAEKANSICEAYLRQSGVNDVALLLSKYNIGLEKSIAVFKALGSGAVEMIERNPYILCEDSINISFGDAEIIAEDYHLDPESECRIAAGLEYVLKGNLLNGHTCLPREKLIETAARLLGCAQETADSACTRLVDALRIFSDKHNGREYISLAKYHAAEQYIAARMCAVKGFSRPNETVDSVEIDIVETGLGIQFEELQRQAIREAFEKGVLILTGGPGTGKTTTLNAIIRLFENRGLSIQLAAPTGRAAQRITELTGREAKTIHRLLEVEWGPEEAVRFARNERFPLDCDVLIVDEASMVDVLLFESLLKALRISCRLILVGDADQLPSIGAGNVLNDLLASRRFPAIRLQKVFRQAAQSNIVMNAHRLIRGETADFSGGGDCFFLKRYDRTDTLATVLELCAKRLPTAYGFQGIEDIQVLCPSKKSDTGSVNLNNLLQERFNPLKKNMPQVFYKGFYIRPGDKVMQVKNNYDIEYIKDNGETGLGVYNGDVGFVTEIDPRAGIVKVCFGDKTVTYFQENIGELELAYAMTVHKSQGSEFECVILPLMDIPFKLCYRNLLYTAVTRARRLLVIVGSEKMWNNMAENDKKTLRYTQLKELIADYDVQAV